MTTNTTTAWTLTINSVPAADCDEHAIAELRKDPTVYSLIAEIDVDGRSIDLVRKQKGDSSYTPRHARGEIVSVLVQSEPTVSQYVEFWDDVPAQEILSRLATEAGAAYELEHLVAEATLDGRELAPDCVSWWGCYDAADYVAAASLADCLPASYQVDPSDPEGLAETLHAEALESGSWLYDHVDLAQQICEDPGDYLSELTGAIAVRFARERGYLLEKHADPTDGYRDDVTPDQADEIVAADPELIYLDLSDPTENPNA